ncbi:MAG: hypothetical protein KF795_26540 [Labilithrix sp.]|nr:hypothetical protein [Labilithrix sp.]
MKSGIAPELLVSQVKNTAAWLWADPRAAAATRALDDLAGAEACQRGAEGTAYLALLLAAHFATVATFVPTDVDARIRHHAWQAMTTSAEVAAACDVVDAVAAWDVHAVSSRVFVSPAHGPLSGHDGEWLAVRAGALGRAAVLGASDVVERLAGQLDAEVDREEAILREVLAKDATAPVLTVATIVAHNLGDLSRVVAEWPKNDVLASLRDRWVRLAHPDAAAGRALFVTAGRINKALVAHENHRFLPLRKPRALRGGRELLLPIGPWFDAWGETVAKSELLDGGDRAEVLAALLELHGRDPAQEGCLRAIAGLHRATRGGIEAFVPDLPARMRKDALRGKVRDVLDVTVEHFAARLDRRYRAERDAGWPSAARPSGKGPR